MHPLNPAIAATFAPPVMEARRWLSGVTFPADRPLINVSQAAPVDPPPEGLRQAIADAAMMRPEAHLYGSVLGNGDLRDAVAAEFSASYGGPVSAGQVAITQGCNQAFCAAMSTLAGPGDQVIVPTPWYFNHKMWLDMSGVQTVTLPCGDSMLPDPDRARALIGPRTRAIVLVTPNNPSGAEYPAELMSRFFDLAQEHGLALVVDETYRDFDSRDAAPHDLLTRPDWDRTLIQLYSFSKAFRLTGHRVGAIVAGEARLAEVEKFLDTVSISASQLGQIGAVWGMTHLRQWLAGERAEILSRRAATASALGALPGWRLKSVGAYFAWVEHPFAESSAGLARRMVRDIGVLALPGTMFSPADDPTGARHLRVAFANVDAAGIAVLAARLRDLRPDPLVARPASS
ncbi:aminotransferase [Paracoccus beibuensis]|uniref:aminotransferase n=1 Tax=Paracoccus beibuensis TaxID=547602 RepID=UPI00223FF369|nr:aminotransferase [Paracoccus beibuensis]